MAATQALMAEEGKSGQAVFEKDADKVKFEVEPKTIGLTREQLEKYRNDPFWRPLRTILFVLFWVAWVVMFAGAILIVVLSPKCAVKQKPEWWQTKVSYQLLTSTFHDTDNDGVGDFKGITEKLDILKKIGVTTVYPSPVISVHKMEYFNPYDVVDHLQVDQRFGTEEDFKGLVDAAHNRDMYVVMDLPVTSVSIHHPWFTGDEKDVFVTAKEGSPAFAQPNYYEFEADNTTKYLGYPGADNPVLNWSNAMVKKTVEDAVKKYLLLGVDGFHIDHISQMAFDESGKTDHETTLAAVKELTSMVKDFVESNVDLKDKKIVLTSSQRDIGEVHAKAREVGYLHYVVDDTFASLSAEKCSNNVAECVHKALSEAYARYPVSLFGDWFQEDTFIPYWQFSNADNPRLASRFDSETADLLTFMQLTLPGAMSLYYGQELGLKDAGSPPSSRGIMQWKPTGKDHHGFLSSTEANLGKLFFAESDDTKEEDNFETQYAQENSALKVNQKLAKMRQRDEALILGSTVRDELVDDVVVYSRYVKGENSTATGTVFVVALNFGSKPSTMDFNNFVGKEIVPNNKDLAKAEVAAVTPGVAEYHARQKLDLTRTKLVLPSKQGVLIRL